MIDNVENSVLQTLLTNQDYFNKVYSHLNKTHFQQIENIEIFNKISEYYNEYQSHPKPKEIGLTLKSIKQEKLRSSVIEHFKYIVSSTKIYNLEFIVNETEKYVKKMEMTKAILEGADAIQNDKDLNPIYGLIGDALRINFDSDLGLVFTEDLIDRLEYYKKKVQGYAQGIKSLDDAFGGGYKKKTLNLVGAPSFGGKSVYLAAYSAYRTLKCDDTIYYTLEMSEYETAKRIDANILDLDINLFKTTPDEVFEHKLNSVKDKLGTLVIKEYPAGVLDTLKIESHINEFYMKYGRKPTNIVVDYITLMKSSRFATGNVNTYSYYKAVAEELHGLAKKYDVVCVSAVQLNRSSFGNKDAGMENVSDSIGLIQTADTCVLMIRTKELDAEKRVIFNIVKNRNTGILSQVICGADFPKMRFYDVDSIQSSSETSETISKFDFSADALNMFE